MNKIKTFWSKGYVYILIAVCLIIFFLIDPHVGMYDWGKEIAYFDVIKTSLTQYHTLPLFWWNALDYRGWPAIQQSSFFLANPETYAFSPFVVLLFVFNSVFFMKLLMLVFFGLGVWGTFYLKQRLKWSDIQFRTYIALFLFSPIIIQHIAIGYFPWLNLYLFPWLVYFLLDENWLESAVGAAAVLALTLLQGGSHPFLWFGIFFGLFCIIRLILQPRLLHLTHMGLVIMLVVLLAFGRLFTSTQTFANFQQQFFNGYSVDGFLKWTLTPPFFTPASMEDIEQFIEGHDNGVPYWDGETFWGLGLILVGFYFIALILGQLKENKGQADGFYRPILAIAIASTIITILSFGHIYQSIVEWMTGLIKSPALAAMEKYPFRYSILGYFGFSVVIAHSIDQIYSMLLRPMRALEKFLKKIKKQVSQKPISEFFKWLAVILLGFTVLWILTAFFYAAIINTINPLIRSAYIGQGYSWMTSLMSKRASIPVEGYLQKLNNLLSWIRQTFLIFLLVAWSVFLIIRFPVQLSIGVLPAVKWLHDNLSFIMEALLVLPLLLASIMWLRVALATPKSSFPHLPFISPQVSINPNVPVVLTVTPAEVTIQSNTMTQIKSIIFPEIKFSDANFLTVKSENAGMVNSNGFIGLVPANDQKIILAVKNDSYQPGVIVMLFSWFVIFCYWIWHVVRNFNNPNRRKRYVG